jgi:hypothetical protein
VRKLAREAVIFMLLGPVVVFVVVFGYGQRQSIGGVKARAAQAVYATDVPPPRGYTVDNSVVVPLTNGAQLYVADCNRLHPNVVKSEPLPSGQAKPIFDMSKAQPIPLEQQTLPGSSNGVDCVYFSDFRKFGGNLVSVPLGEENQVAIEKEYWTAYADAKHEMRGENALLAGYLSLYGFPGGLAPWGLYRLVRFAVKG